MKKNLILASCMRISYHADTWEISVPNALVQPKEDREEEKYPSVFGHPQPFSASLRVVSPSTQFGMIDANTRETTNGSERLDGWIHLQKGPIVSQRPISLEMDSIIGIVDVVPDKIMHKVKKSAHLDRTSSRVVSRANKQSFEKWNKLQAGNSARDWEEKNPPLFQKEMQILWKKLRWIFELIMACGGCRPRDLIDTNNQYFTVSFDWTIRQLWMTMMKCEDGRECDWLAKTVSDRLQWRTGRRKRRGKTV